jgi:hypothetical protein
MKRLRELVGRHRTAAAIIAVAVAAFAVWKAYLMVSGSAQPTPAAAVRPASPTPAGTSGAGPSGDAALRAAGHLAGVQAPRLPGTASTGDAMSDSTSAGATSTAATAGGRAGLAATTAMTAPVTTPPPANTGRPDPFSPLATPGGGARSANPPLPPVPPLSPNALGTSASPAVPAQASVTERFHLTGIVNGPTAVAILNDGADSYIVEPGDTVTSGVRLVAIDAGNRTVTLASQNQSWQLRLGGGTGR